MIVIDVGCAKYGGDYSIERLIEEFDPEVLWGFDPNPAVPEEATRVDERAHRIELRRQAAWTYDGFVGYLEEGLNSCLTDRADAPKVPCFDLARFIRELPRDGDIVCKIDAEGAEFELLDHLIATGADRLLKLAWVEWHAFGVDDPAGRRASIEERIGCEIAEWTW